MRFDLKLFATISIIIIAVFVLDAVTVDFMLIGSIHDFIGYITSFSIWYPASPDLVINETSDYDAGVKANTSTYTDDNLISQNTLQLGNHTDGTYWTLGNWTSDTITMTASNKLSNTTLNFTASNWANISKIEWLKDSDNSVLATYDYDIDSGLSGTAGLVNDTDLINYWRLNGNAIDEKGNNDGTLNGDASYTTGKFGQGVTLDGTGDYITFTPNGIVSAVTFSTWIKTTAASSAYDAIMMEANAGQLRYGFEMDTSERVVWGVKTDTAASRLTADDFGSLADGNWHHIVGTWDGSTLKVYVDGVKETTELSNTGTMTATAQFQIGRYGTITTYDWAGTIDEPAVFLDALTQSEITALYDSSKAKFINNNTLTSGSFDDVDEDFKIKLYLAGNGAGTPIIEDIIGYYETLALSSIDQYQCYYTNDTTMGLNLTSGAYINSTDSIMCNETDKIEVTGNITNYGNLTLNQTYLEFGLTSDGQYNITSYSGSILNITNQANITSNDTTYEYTILADENSTFEMRDSYLSECGYTSTPLSSRGLNVYSNSTKIINNTFYNNYDSLTINNSYFGNIENNTFEDKSVRYPIRTSYCGNLTINNNSFVANDYEIWLLYTNHTNITNNTFNNGYDDIIRISSYSSHNLIYNNDINVGASDGIRIDGHGGYNDVINNTIYNITSAEKLLTITDNCIYTQVINNTLENSLNNAIEISSSDHTYIKSNTFTNNGDATDEGGIYVSDSGCANTTITNNTFHNNYYWGIGDSGTNTIIANNTIENNTASTDLGLTSTNYGIAFAGTNGYSYDNSIKNVSAGILFYQVSANSTQDSIEDSTQYGIQVYQTSTGPILNNIIINNSGNEDYISEISGVSTAYDITFNDTTASFEATDVSINDLPDPEPIPTNLVSLDEYLTITNNDGDAWIELNLSYDNSLELNEENIDLYKNDSAGWVAQSGIVNTENNYVSKNITSFSPFGLFEDNYLIINSILIQPDDGDPDILINPVEDSNKTISVTVNFENRTEIDKCYLRIFNSTESYSNPVFGPIESTIQNCTGATCDCYKEWDIEYWRNDGDWNISIDINSTEDLTNFTSDNFTYNTLTAMSVNTSTITFTAAPGETVESLDAYPLQVKNTGNQIFNVSVNGTDFEGQTDATQTIGVGNSTYSETTTGTFKSLTNTYERAFTSMVPALTKLLYFKGHVPVGFKSQTYQGYVEFRIN